LPLASLALDVLVEQVGHKGLDPLGVRRHVVAVGRQKSRQIGAKLLAGGVALVGALRQRLEHNLIEHRRHPRRAQRRWINLRIADSIDQLVTFAALLREQLPAGQELPQDDARRVHVGATVDELAPRLLRRHVRHLAVDDAGGGLFQLQRRASQAKVGQLDLAIEADQHVGRRDIAVNQLDVAEVVGVVKTSRQLASDVTATSTGKAMPFLAQRFHTARRSLPSM
jgi:hypothetical protein